MASLMKGYRQYLLPITEAPTPGRTDPSSLFNIQGNVLSTLCYIIMFVSKIFIAFYCSLENVYGFTFHYVQGGICGPFFDGFECFNQQGMTKTCHKLCWAMF